MGTLPVAALLLLSLGSVWVGRSPRSLPPAWGGSLSNQPVHLLLALLLLAFDHMWQMNYLEAAANSVISTQTSSEKTAGFVTAEI